ncbi:hypothetical protein [Spirosoma sordidisoli]|uniref:Uncharacterized protein n=1 Tax=Spirosoma sordidisoli TaxID=2502893 RepID=A0A4Q2UK54_9BACT|nr:hypothetical protein [Spirosoma sordidisoli]RYC69654.1 hypothetical protein EQG79_13720 [Spirosoma sordidisoli]
MHKQINLLEIVVGFLQINPLIISFSRYHLQVVLLQIDNTVPNDQGLPEETRWQILHMHWYLNRSSWQSVIADFYVMGRYFSWRKNKANGDDLPF